MKYVVLGILVFILYRMISKPKSLDTPPPPENIQEPDDEGFVDYEEVE